MISVCLILALLHDLKNWYEDKLCEVYPVPWLKEVRLQLERVYIKLRMVNQDYDSRATQWGSIKSQLVTGGLASLSINR